MMYVCMYCIFAFDFGMFAVCAAHGVSVHNLYTLVCVYAEVGCIHCAFRTMLLKETCFYDY